MGFKFAGFKFIEENWFVVNSNFVCDFFEFIFFGFVHHVHP